MSRRKTAASVAPFMGRDLRLEYVLSGGFFEDADLSVREDLSTSAVERDLGVAEGLDNLTQALANRLKTRRGELTALGHPDYGSRHHELIGEPNVDRTRNLVKLYVLQALRREPRIVRVLEASVVPEHDPPRDTVRIELQVEVVDQATPLNLVVPFSFEASL